MPPKARKGAKIRLVDLTSRLCGEAEVTVKNFSYLLRRNVACSRDFLVLGQDIRQRPDRGDAVGIYLPVGLCVMFPDVFELGGVSKGGQVPVEMSEPAVQGGVTGTDVADVALEVLDVDDVEAHDCRVETDVRFGN